MSYIIDRRQNAKKKSTVNRQRFLRRYRQHIKRAVDDAVNSRSITDLERGESISIPSKDISEPAFHHGQGGVRKRVYPGNKEFVEGDQFKRPEGGGGGGGSGKGKASDQGEGEDEFTFQIDQEEFLDFMFSDLELPNMVKKQLRDSSEFTYRRGGYTKAGSPEKLNIVRSLRAAHARRIALSGKERRRVRELHREIEALNEAPDKELHTARIAELEEEIRRLKIRIHRMPFLDEFDLKFNNFIKVPNPSTKAVMFCIMDVSGSMTQDIKNIAKRFFLLLYLFLKRNYKRIDVVFVRHHTQAKEVDEEEFFYSRETGGTIVSSALKLTSEIIEQRYNPTDWNIYIAQASDGDNWEGDSSVAKHIVDTKILPLVQYFAYVEISRGPIQNLWMEYSRLERENEGLFAMEQITSASDIYRVFRRLFEKKE